MRLLISKSSDLIYYIDIIIKQKFFDGVSEG